MGIPEREAWFVLKHVRAIFREILLEGGSIYLPRLFTVYTTDVDSFNGYDPVRKQAMRTKATRRMKIKPSKDITYLLTKQMEQEAG